MNGKVAKILAVSGVMMGMAAIVGAGGVQVGHKAPEFPKGAIWLNSDPITLKSLRGKVILVDFWEYTCVNCLRTLPYLRKWHQKYASNGLVIIGVHTPEFLISQKKENVETFAKREGLIYPIVLDNDRRIWQSYQGMGGYWPRKYLIDSRGVIRYDIIGEGSYEKTEFRIRELLKESGKKLTVEDFVGYVREEDEPGVVCYPQTPETYAGYRRGWFAGIVARDKDWRYRATPMAEEGRIVLDGSFRVESERVVHTDFTETYRDSIGLKWKGSELNAVMEPGDAGIAHLKVEINGKPVEPEMRGPDLAENRDRETVAVVDFPRMYQLVSGKKWGEYFLRIFVKQKGFALYAFTFGSCIRSDRSK